MFGYAFIFAETLGSTGDQEKNSIFQLQLKSPTKIIRNIALAC